MKSLLYFLITALFLSIIVSCNQSDPPLDVTTCLEDLPDSAVSPPLAREWMDRWENEWASKYTTGSDPQGGYWPSQFYTDMDDFQALIQDNNQFRVYYAFCQLNSSDNYAHLFSAPIDNTSCNRVISSNIFNFSQIEFGEPVNECSEENGGSVSYEDAKDWTANFRDKFSISDSNKLFTPEGSSITFSIPMAFTYDKNTFYENIDTSANTLYVKLGIDTIIQANESLAYEFKLLFDTDSIGGTINYVDFASPCPYACPKKDSLIGIY